VTLSSITPPSTSVLSAPAQHGSTLAQGDWFQTVTADYGTNQKDTRWGTAISAFDVFQHALEVSEDREQAGRGVDTSVDTYAEFVEATVRNGGRVVYDRHYEDGQPDTELKLGKGDRVVQSNGDDNSALSVKRANGSVEALNAIYIPVGTKVATVD
jgi:hypothetical protein